MSDQPKTPENHEDVETVELGDDAMENISGGLPNGGELTINGEGASYGGLTK